MAVTSSSVSIHVCWAAGVVAALIVAGCAEDVPITTEPGLVHSEVTDRVSIGNSRPQTLLVVGDPEVLAASAELLVASLSPVIGRPYPSRLWVQLVVMSPQAAADAFEALVACRENETPCDISQPPTVVYRAGPYGYGTDIATWAQNASCLLNADTDCSTESDAVSTFTDELHPTVVLWLEDDTECNADDACAMQPMARVLALNEEHYLPHRLYVVGEAPQREDLETIALDEYGPSHEGIGGIGVSERVALDSNGMPRCVLHETLPTTGPITRCEQLTDYGRTPDSVDADDHEVCRITLQPEPLTAAPQAPGFYYARNHPSGLPMLVVNFEVIGGSSFEWRCVLNVD